MFLLLVLLTRLGELHADPHPDKTFLETTIPEKISSSDAKTDPENNIAYIITIKGKPYFVHLRKQSFLSLVSVVYFYDKDDIQYSKPLSAQMDCNYQGYVAGFPNSLVSLNTCSGLRGTLQLKNISYGIEPMEAVSGFVHMIYEEKNDNTNIPLLGENKTYSYNNLYYHIRRSSERTEFFKLYPQYLEIYIVVDKNLCDYMGSDIKVVTQKIIQIIGFVNTILSQLKLTVVISSIEIWSNKNKISTTGNPNIILSRFLEWKYKHVSQPHQTAYLFAFKKHPSFIGATFPGKICNKNYAVGVALYPEDLSLESYTISIVQLLGFNLGLSYDNPDTCYCSEDVCTMSPKAVQSRGVKDFSTCTLDDFKYLASHSGLGCLQRILPEMPVYKQQKKRTCGNGQLEQGEQCDCGTVKNCTHKDCCDPKTCSMKANKQCGSGECCTQDCKLKSIGIQCRKSYDECDFTEYCNGVSPHCMPDTYARNGQSCDSGDSFCYKGRCRIFTKQCKELIGGVSWSSSFCTPGCYYDPKTKFTQKYCVNFNCVEIQYQVNYQTCNSSHHCNSHGICNNLNHCHCQNGFAPPECLEKKGEFGSIDDGHIPPSGKSDLGGRSTTPSKHRFELIFYISLPLLIITAAVVIKQNKIRELCYRGETESDRSVSEESSSNSKLSPSER
ncbi:disintegrin and metalloproteinase domain-containing protein 5-like [Puma concolor]|uniref:Disintegrin and metalloproteinase domain-containing protein 5-like n=1 Tax=Puma concolor TaxID=9696 RepID=A0A6P6HQK9_PUMCO|nr:disintegrin and metalloproteinase domain-containing protein 5-like [Puma concolor]